ncbi:AAA family ATPase [Actinoplanes bogorensis]|uniref:AAA family ATPase n=1 Tax=Paractinoplanes bogorensis TaxID=1610840 RepID=A0ABS5YXM0_9ACTN|nr:AAA family ATPase [Actinoplanes bogorensis]MBU2668195.1 AAA family ATPase [Actinoplanes bogorensis]
MSAVHEGMDLRLLGPVRASRDGVEFALGSARRTAVLCVLALHAGRAVSREQLIAGVWGEDAPASATANVYTYVSSLRQALEPARDRWAAGQLLTSGGGVYELHIRPGSVDVLRFEALRETARERRAAGDAAGELDAVREALALWDEAEPLEGVPGPFAAAQRLRLTELRLATAERMAELETGGTTRPAPDVPLPARRPPVARQRLFLSGRTAEVRHLRRAATEAMSGRGRSVRIEGGPGSGKTVLVAAALDGLDRVGWAVGDELAQRLPLGVLLDCATDADPDLARRLVALAADEHAGGIVDRAARLVRDAAAAAPLILVADDLHWADPLTVRVWAALAAGLDEVPLLLVATTRQARGPAADVIALGPLDPGAATALIRAAAPEPPEPRRLTSMLDDAGGNPYYLRHLAEDRTGASLAAAVEAHLAPLPEATRMALRGVAFLGAWTLARPGPEPVSCVLSELATAGDRDPDEVAAALGPARDAGLLILDDDRAEFRHRVVARTLHESTPGALRTALHRSFADRLASAGGPPELVVAQLLAGDVPLDDSIAAWLSVQVEPLAWRSPQIAVTVLQRVRAHHGLAPARRLPLTAWLARLLLRERRNAAAEAGWVAARTTDPEMEGEMRWIAARSHEQRGRFEVAAEIARGALREQRITPTWAEALRQLLARVTPEPALVGDRT